MRQPSHLRRPRLALGMLAVPGAAALLLAAPAVGQEPAQAAAPAQDIVVPLRPLLIDKTVEPHYTRVNHWSIDKWAKPEAGWDQKDRTVAVEYWVRVVKGQWTATDVVVTGTISVTNPNARQPFAYDVKDVMPNAQCEVGPAEPNEVDVVAAQGVVIPDANGSKKSFLIKPGRVNHHRYRCVLDYLPGKTVWNKASIEYRPAILEDTVAASEAAQQIQPPPPKSQWASVEVPVHFSDAPYDEIDARVRVTDTMDGDQTRVLAKSLDRSKDFVYTKYLKAWKDKCRVYHNTARLIGLTALPMATLDQRVADDAAPRMMDEDSERYAYTETAEAWAQICPPPPPPAPKDNGKPNTAPPVVVVGNNGQKKDPVVVVPRDNPKDGVVIDDPKAPVGSLEVTKLTRTRRAHVGDLVIWKIWVKNTGKADLRKVLLVDMLPRQLAVVTEERQRRVKKLAIRVGDLPMGSTRSFEINTRVLGGPMMDPVAAATARTKQRNEGDSRMRRGVVCNGVVAIAANAASDQDEACIRVLRPLPELD